MQIRLPNRQKINVRLTVEQLEERCVLSTLGNPALLPIPGGSPSWIGRFVQLATAPRRDRAVVFLGDSITEGFAVGRGAPVWSTNMAPLGAANFGISGNTTQN